MIIFLHGAYSASDVFYHFTKNPWDDFHFIDYDTTGNLLAVTSAIRQKISEITSEPVHLVGHSLGGVIAVTLEKQGMPVKSIVTLGSPFGGIGGWWPPKTIGYEISKFSRFMATPPKTKHQFYVSMTGHNPWYVFKNDGVVAISSQKAIPKANYIEVFSNHFGILSNPAVLDNIQKFHLEVDHGSPQNIRIA